MSYSRLLSKHFVGWPNLHDYHTKLFVLQVFTWIKWQIYLARPLRSRIKFHSWILFWSNLTGVCCEVTRLSLSNTSLWGTPPRFHSRTRADSRTHPILFIDSRCDWRCRSFHHIFKWIVPDCKINLACAHSKVAAKHLRLPSLMFKLTLGVPAFVQEGCFKGLNKSQTAVIEKQFSIYCLRFYHFQFTVENKLSDVGCFY